MVVTKYMVNYDSCVLIESAWWLLMDYSLSGANAFAAIMMNEAVMDIWRVYQRTVFQEYSTYNSWCG